MSAPDISKRLKQWTIHDDEFAAAYEQVGDIHRSWLKKSIATSFSLATVPDTTSHLLERKWPDGFRFQTYETPCDWVFLLLGAGFLSPVQLCAALIPPLLTGVKELVLLREDDGEPFPPTLLTACELSGWETVCQLPKEELILLTRARQKTDDHGRILNLGFQKPETTSLCSQQIVSWQAPSRLRAGIIFSDAGQWDYRQLDWAHPGQLFHYWGSPKKNCPLLLKQEQSTPENFCSDVLFAPETLLQRQIVLGLTPGQELSWYWPRLSPVFFRATRTALIS